MEEWKLDELRRNLKVRYERANYSFEVLDMAQDKRFASSTKHWDMQYIEDICERDKAVKPRKAIITTRYEPAAKDFRKWGTIFFFDEQEKLYGIAPMLWGPITYEYKFKRLEELMPGSLLDKVEPVDMSEQDDPYY